MLYVKCGEPVGSHHTPDHRRGKAALLLGSMLVRELLATKQGTSMCEAV